MQCPLCRRVSTVVVDSRQTQDANAVRRRRECPHCNCRFTTIEKAVTNGRNAQVGKCRA